MFFHQSPILQLQFQLLVDCSRCCCSTPSGVPRVPCSPLPTALWTLIEKVISSLLIPSIFLLRLIKAADIYKWLHERVSLHVCQSAPSLSSVIEPDCGIPSAGLIRCADWMEVSSLLILASLSFYPSYCLSHLTGFWSEFFLTSACLTVLT